MLAVARKTTGVLVLSTVLLSSCTGIKLEPYTTAERDARIAADRDEMYGHQESVREPITFYVAVARALKYNLDYRLKLMETALASDLSDMSAHEMLPNVVASAGMAGRSNASGGTSIGIEDGTESLRPSTSQERYRDLSGLGMSWSLLDFGVAYYRSKQRSDQVLMAEERRRRVAQNVLQDVRNAYWRALGAQRLLPEVDKLLARTNKALASAREAEAKGLRPREEILAYQRALLDSVYLLTVRRQDLEFAQAELSALMSLPPGSKLVLADQGEEPLPVVNFNGNIEKLEQLSLENRPEIMEEWYRKRVNALDLEIAKAQLWPNISIDLSYQYDSNKYLYNNNWAESALNVSLNLLRLTQIPSLNSAIKSQEKTDNARRIALSMAILTEVRVGALRYDLATQEVQFADDSLRVDRELLDYAQAAKTSTMGTELEVIRAEGRYLLSRYQREAAYSRAQAAWGRLYNSIGFDVLPQQIDKLDVMTVAKEVEKELHAHEAQQLLVSMQEPVNAPKL